MSVLIVILIMLTPPAAAAPPVVWGELEPGTHSVGFISVLERDRARGYFSDFSDRSREIGRPIQFAVWYPAEAGTGTAMDLGDFIEIRKSELGSATAREAEEIAAEYRRGPMRPYFDGEPSQAEWESILAVSMASRRDAAPEEGPFPLVLHAGGGATAQGVLFELLASHGYVVVSLPLLGTGPAWHGRGEWTVRAIEEMESDLGHAARWASRLPYVDPRRIAVIGMSAGARNGARVSSPAPRRGISSNGRRRTR
ncbi:MAG TPA: hypothetical protein VMS98_09700 [Thermoanaerobaculia bacterium]|nr:hypothetical protein [Thermoanaerobaculia bacterium]